MSNQSDATRHVVSEVSRIVSEMSGIELGEKQSQMVESRLKSRIAHLHLAGFNEYLNYLKVHVLDESQALLSLLTTHHTYFFREFSHFEFLINQAIPRMIDAARKRGDKEIHIWSAACSSGQEVYSLAMLMNFHLAASAPDIKFSILGTDVDPRSVATAKNGVYRAEELKTVPAMYMGNNWIRGTGAVANYFKAASSLRQKVKFEVLNLTSPTLFADEKRQFDLIFCRNVFIYFSEPQIKKIVSSQLKHLTPQGYCVLGVSESLVGLGLPVRLVGTSIYEREGVSRSEQAQSEVKQTNKVYKVLCVDDSSSIHALLGRVLVKEKGFEITGHATNGREALALLARQKFDAITLDLHMPEMDGLEFLRTHSDRSAPILIISSVDRDEKSLGQRALSLGAFDYVEKPSFDNLNQAGEEIRSKLKAQLSAKSGATSQAMAQSAPAPRAQSLQPLRVLVVDDSPTIRSLLAKVLNPDAGFQIVGESGRPNEVEAMVENLKPDLITLDIHMPEMDGVSLLKKLRRRFSTPVVMISSISREEGPQVLEALESGAVDYIQKPSMNEIGMMAPVICERLKAAARSGGKRPQAPIKMVRPNLQMNENCLILIGSSTGGTEALRHLLAGLPPKIPPILIVQHIPAVFSQALAERLNSLFSFDVLEARDGQEVKPNQVLIAPGGKQMAVVDRSGKLFIRISDDGPVNRHNPSVDYLFASASQLKNKKIVAAILTGMGADGAAQTKVLRDLGARTIAQDEKTSVVFGMPQETIKRGGAEFVLPLGDIAEKLASLCSDVEARKSA